MRTGPAIWLRLVHQEMDNIHTVNAGSSSTNLDSHSCTSNEEELDVLPLIPARRSREAYDFDGLFGPLDRISNDKEHDIDWKYTCRNSCDPDEANKDAINSLEVLVELGCHCRGSIGRMCIKCLLKWFGPRIMLDKDMTCEVCQTLLNESVRKTVLSALADHTGGRDILIEVLGPRLVQAHEARTPQTPPSSRYAHNPGFQTDEFDVEEVPHAPYGAAHAAHVAAIATDAASASDTSGTPASGTPTSSSSPASNQLRSGSIFTKIRRYMCCAAKPALVL